MRNSGFRQQSLEEIKEKQAIKREKDRLKIPSRKPKTALQRKKPKKVRNRLPSLKSLREKADALLTPICKKQSPNCESCNQPTQVGHHWIEKSRSSFLRYDLRNLIPLCHSCHAKIHNRFGNSIMGGFEVAEIIISKRGKEWKIQLDLDQPKYQKVNRDFYIEHFERLTSILNGV